MRDFFNKKMNFLAFSLFLFFVFTKQAEGKMFSSQYIWSNNLLIYQINTETEGEIQITKFAIDAISKNVYIAENNKIILPKSTKKILSAEILNKENPILFLLTSELKLFSIDLISGVIINSIELNKYFHNQTNTSGFLTVFQETLVIAINSNISGFISLNVSNNQYNDLKLTRLEQNYKFITSPKIIIGHQKTKFLAAIQNKNEFAILEIDMESSNKHHLHCCNEKLIKHFIVGPPIINAHLSLYIIEHDDEKNFLFSYNFKHKICIPCNSTVFLKHGELVFFNLAQDKVFSINAKTGKIREPLILYTEHKQLNIENCNIDFLFWDPVEKIHVLIKFHEKTVYIRCFELNFDKPKIMSWKKDIVM